MATDMRAASRNLLPRVLGTEARILAELLQEMQPPALAHASAACAERAPLRETRTKGGNEIAAACRLAHRPRRQEKLRSV